MKISNVTSITCDGGWRPWTFVKVETDVGTVGYGECSDDHLALAIAGCVADLAPAILGRDPRPIQQLRWDLLRLARQNLGGVAYKAIGGIEAALWDIKGKELGIPVYELWGGPTRDRIRVYWSHCGTTRAMRQELLGTPPLRTYEDVARLGKEVVARGFTALKTNLVFPGSPPSVLMQGLRGPAGTSDQNLSAATLNGIVRLISTLRDAVGPDVEIALDLNFNFRRDGIQRIAHAMEPFNLLWLEFDSYDPRVVLEVKRSTSTPICTGENLYGLLEHEAVLQMGAVDTLMLDVAWNGLIEAKRIADFAAIHEVNIAPHNYYSPLATAISAHLCAVVPNVRILETDIDDVPWKELVVDNPPQIVDGFLVLPSGPGWGVDLNEVEIAKHRYEA